MADRDFSARLAADPAALCGFADETRDLILAAASDAAFPRRDDILALVSFADDVAAGGGLPAVPALPDRRASSSSSASVDLVKSSEGDDYPAVCCMIGDDLRVSVNGKGNRYFLQTAIRSGKRVSWGSGAFYATKAKLLAAHKGVKGLASAMKSCPARPVGLFPAFVADRARQAAAFEASDTARCAYGGVLAVCDDWRLVIDADGSAYRLQFVHPMAVNVGFSGHDMWVSSFASSDLVPIVGNIRLSEMAAFGSFSEMWPSLPVKLLPALANLPRSVADCEVPDLPDRPLSVKSQRKGARRPAVAS